MLQILCAFRLYKNILNKLEKNEITTLEAIKYYDEILNILPYNYKDLLENLIVEDSLDIIYKIKESYIHYEKEYLMFGQSNCDIERIIDKYNDKVLISPITFRRGIINTNIFNFKKKILNLYKLFHISISWKKDKYSGGKNKFYALINSFIYPFYLDKCPICKEDVLDSREHIIENHTFEELCKCFYILNVKELTFNYERKTGIERFLERREEIIKEKRIEERRIVEIENKIKVYKFIPRIKTFLFFSIEGFNLEEAIQKVINFMRRNRLITINNMHSSYHKSEFWEVDGSYNIELCEVDECIKCLDFLDDDNELNSKSIEKFIHKTYKIQ